MSVQENCYTSHDIIRTLQPLYWDGPDNEKLKSDIERLVGAQFWYIAPENLLLFDNNLSVAALQTLVDGGEFKVKACRDYPRKLAAKTVLKSTLEDTNHSRYQFFLNFCDMARFCYLTPEEHGKVEGLRRGQADYNPYDTSVFEDIDFVLCDKDYIPILKKSDAKAREEAEELLDFYEEQCRDEDDED